MRLDRLIKSQKRWGKRQVRDLLEAGEVRVNGVIVESASTLIGKFDLVELSDKVLQSKTRRTVMLNKPSGVVSATRDAEHETVIDLIKERWAGELHLAGRLDRFTTGLVILTNDSSLSESLTEPEQKVGKVYLVGTDKPITSKMITVFQNGMRFAKENVTTAPAQVELMNDRKCRLTIYEGKHHQVKRMFARFDIKVVSLHRERVGEFDLGDLSSGEWRVLDL